MCERVCVRMCERVCESVCERMCERISEGGGEVCQNNDFEYPSVPRESNTPSTQPRKESIKMGTNKQE